MARTAELHDFVDADVKAGGGKSRLKGLAKMWKRYVWAREGHALMRIELEAPFLFDAETLKQMKSDHRARKPQ